MSQANRTRACVVNILDDEDFKQRVRDHLAPFQERADKAISVVVAFGRSLLPGSPSELRLTSAHPRDADG